ncbi:MAG TPA: 2-dehydropantoate 2-reductase [Burkholderiales bacterium]|jgi:2-dehydropantoate 2-reductase|nr:2-dehydropantoate 2-reductase [Burkholderiales bacterium]
MKICIYGAGAVGGVLAASLARAGHDVSVVARGAHLEAIRGGGLRIRSRADRSEYTARIAADSDPSKLGPQDYVIVCVKAHGLAQVARTIGPLVAQGTSIITAMNGVPWWLFHRRESRFRLESLDPGGALERAMPTERIVGCVVHFAASTPEPGVISHNMGRRLILGEPGGQNTARTARIVEALAAAGLEAVASAFIEKDFWVKLLGNVSFNPVSALTMSTADRLIASREVKDYMVEIMREVLAIGRAVGVDADIDPEARIDMARSLGVFKTSMLQDLEAGKPLEIDGLLAGTLEIAAKGGVRAPFTESLFGLIRARAVATGQYQPATP